MKKLYCLIFLFFGHQASSEILYCAYLNSVVIEIGGKEIDYAIYDESEYNSPSAWIEFNFDDLTTTYFWNEGENQKGLTIENLIKVHDQFYYARVDESEYVSYSTFLFEDGKHMGMLAEDGYVSSFQCWEKNQRDIEKEYGISFKPYY